jgi:hypothetical protein
LVRIFFIFYYYYYYYYFLILSHTHRFLLNSPTPKLSIILPHSLPYEKISNLGMCFLGRSSGSGLIMETSKSYHISLYDYTP